MSAPKVVNQWLHRQVRGLFALLGDGYARAYGAGAAVTQITSRTTAVICNSWCGAITLVSAAGSTTTSQFTVNCNKIKSTDCVNISQKSGADRYSLDITNVQDGSFEIAFNTRAGTTTEQPVFNFAIMKGAID